MSEKTISELFLERVAHNPKEYNKIVDQVVDEAFMDLDDEYEFTLSDFFIVFKEIYNQLIKILRLRFEPIHEAVAKVLEAAVIESRQRHGVKYAWCGEWVNCKCGNAWSFGGNWNDCDPTGPCPQCQLNVALDELRRALEADDNKRSW